MSSSETHSLVPLRLVRVVVRETSSQQWIFLEEDNGSEEPRGFPIVIGSGEATEIHRVVNDIPSERPMTHQLTLSAIHALGSRLLGVDVVDLRANTFYAQLRLTPPGSSGLGSSGLGSSGLGGSDPDDTDEILVDARPSDALALALRAGARIRIAESVLEQVRTDKSQDILPDDAPLEIDIDPSELGPPEEETGEESDEEPDEL
ncbi:bifunctional nuclease family protein [Planctomycetota bacterium]|nr:bifunctional nuclease family protein [Planctomycetota bacterium]